VILNDKLLLGAHGLATEVGHLLLRPDGPLCGCGQRGCLEALASGPSIARNARDRLARGEGADSPLHALVETDPAQLSTAIIGQAAQAGDAFALGLLAEAGEAIGYGLASLLHLFNPSIVVIGGGVSLVGEVLFEPIRATVRRHAMNETYWREVPIVPAALGDDAGLVGAGALAMEESRARVMPDR
jgi:glucokinase